MGNPTFLFFSKLCSVHLKAMIFKRGLFGVSCSPCTDFLKLCSGLSGAVTTARFSREQENETRQKAYRITSYLLFLECKRYWNAINGTMLKVQQPTHCQSNNGSALVLPPKQQHWSSFVPELNELQVPLVEGPRPPITKLLKGKRDDK